MELIVSQWTLFVGYIHGRLSTAFPQLRHLRHPKAWAELSKTHTHK
jgi:hypothetical protein